MCVPLPKLHAQSKRTITLIEEDCFLGQGYTSSCASLLEPPDKLPKTQKEKLELGTAVHVCNPCTSEAEAGGSP